MLRDLNWIFSGTKQPHATPPAEPGPPLGAAAGPWLGHCRIHAQVRRSGRRRIPPPSSLGAAAEAAAFVSGVLEATGLEVTAEASNTYTILANI
jgi:hypothetical protein